jgi:hypothetical protein
VNIGRRGESKLSSIIYLLIAGIIFYFLYKMIPPYMDFFALEDEVNVQLRMPKIVSREVILNDIYQKAVDHEMPIEKKDIKLNITEDGRMDVYIYWQVDVEFGKDIVKTLEFEVDAANYRRNSEE